MPLFKRNDLELKSLKVVNFKTEKELQTLIEKNLDTVFNCQFVATEFSTGKEHSGRIDSLALSEDGNPVIIEYKITKSRELITQSLYYLSWLNDHQGDFRVVADNQLGHKTEINWDAIRVICIAPSYSKFDLHAVKAVGANIELWRYKFFEDGSIYFEDISRRESNLLNDFGGTDLGKNPVMVAAGKKGAITRATGKYELKQHLNKADGKTKPILESLRDFTLTLDESIEEVPKKKYIAYKVAQNFVCIEVQKKKILLYLKLDPKKIKPLPKGARDVTKGRKAGNLEFTVNSEEDITQAEQLIRTAFEAVGG